MACKNCGEVLSQTPGKRQREFCDSTCRSNYWQKEARRKAKVEERKVDNDLATFGVAMYETTADGVRHVPLASKEAEEVLDKMPGMPKAVFGVSRSFRDYLDLVKSGKFDKMKLEAEVRSAPGLTAGQRDMVIAKIRNA